MTSSTIVKRVCALRENPYAAELERALVDFELSAARELGENEPRFDGAHLRFSDDGGSIYILYLYCVIDRLNGEYGRFESDSAIFEAAFARLLAARRGPRPRARLKIWT